MVISHGFVLCVYVCLCVCWTEESWYLQMNGPLEEVEVIPTMKNTSSSDDIFFAKRRINLKPFEVERQFPRIGNFVIDFVVFGSISRAGAPL